MFVPQVPGSLGTPESPPLCLNVINTLQWDPFNSWYPSTSPYNGPQFTLSHGSEGLSSHGISLSDPIVTLTDDIIIHGDLVVDMDEFQWTAIVNDFFDAGDLDWLHRWQLITTSVSGSENINQIPPLGRCPDISNNLFLGGPGLLGASDRLRASMVIPPHYALKLGFSLHYFDAWQDDHGYGIDVAVTLGSEAEKVVGRLTEKGCHLLFTDLCHRNAPSICGGPQGDILARYHEIHLTHNSPKQEQMIVEFRSQLPADRDNVSWGLDDFTVSVQLQGSHHPPIVI